MIDFSSDSQVTDRPIEIGFIGFFILRHDFVLPSHCLKFIAYQA